MGFSLLILLAKPGNEPNPGGRCFGAGKLYVVPQLYSVLTCYIFFPMTLVFVSGLSMIYLKIIFNK